MAVFSILDILSKEFPSDILQTHSQHNDETAIVRKESILQIMKFLKTNPALDFSVLMDLTAVDCLMLRNKTMRFEVVYHLFSLAKRHRVRIKAGVDERDAMIDSITSLWPVADWFEREVWDMFGIGFHGHPNLTRILMYEGFVGHPLRKDYPITKRQPLTTSGR